MRHGFGLTLITWRRLGRDGINPLSAMSCAGDGDISDAFHLEPHDELYPVVAAAPGTTVTLIDGGVVSDGQPEFIVGVVPSWRGAFARITVCLCYLHCDGQ